MRYLAASTPPLAACALGILSLVEAASILTFTDPDCRIFSKSITVKDSTGSGDCTMLTPGYTSFMIGSLGDDCAGMLCWERSTVLITSLSMKLQC